VGLSFFFTTRAHRQNKLVPRPALRLTIAGLVILSCRGQKSGSEGSVDDHRTPVAETEATTPDGADLDSIAHVPVGDFLVGSRPGDPGRRPTFEPLEQKKKLGPFRIDAYPYPGDPSKPPRLGVSQSEATALCAKRQGRLCTELEWERACRGSASTRYPKGDEPCSIEERCVSGFDVAFMTMLPEWTASTFDEGSPRDGHPVVRGVSADVPAIERRCARRGIAEKGQPVGFRCCYGAPNAAHLEEPRLGRAYTETELSTEELRQLLARDERTKPLSATAKLFQPEAAATVLARGPGQTMGFTLTTSPVIWQPERGSRLLVIAGRSDPATSFVLAYHLAHDEKILAGSFIMKQEPGPIALAYAESIRPRIHFSGCWGCPGETGKVLFRPPEEVVLLQP